MREIQVWSLGQEAPLDEGMATHSSILAWRIPCAEEPGGLQSMDLQRVWNTEHTQLYPPSSTRQKKRKVWRFIPDWDSSYIKESVRELRNSFSVRSRGGSCQSKMKVPTEDGASLFLVQVWASLQTCFFRQQNWEPAVTVIARLCPQCFKWQLGSRPVRISKRGLSFITSQKKFGGGGCYPWSSLVGSDLGLDIQGWGRRITASSPAGTCCFTAAAWKWFHLVLQAFSLGCLLFPLLG